MARPPISQTLVDALSRPTETTLGALIREFGWDDRDILAASLDLTSTMVAWDLECMPKVGEFGLDDLRVVRRRSSNDPTALFSDEISRGEGATIEFKETLVLDVRKYLIGGRPKSECHSNDVLHSSLKTIAGFLNTEGGALLIGVSDRGELVGINREYDVIPGRKPDFDNWELYLRSCIEGRFVNGRSINSSIIIQRVEIEGLEAARLVVGRRRGLSILKYGDAEQLYVRSGNRTISVSFSDLSQFFEMRRLY